MKKALFLLLILALILLPGCAGKETAPEETPASLWEELLPWGEEWTCLLLGGREPSSELEPESGKAERTGGGPVERLPVPPPGGGSRGETPGGL